MKTFTTPIRPDQHQWIKDEAARRGIRMQDLVVEILDTAMQMARYRVPVRRKLETVDVLGRIPETEQDRLF